MMKPHYDNWKETASCVVSRVSVDARLSRIFDFALFRLLMFMFAADLIESFLNQIASKA
jgi:hypothetical protein